MTISTSLYDMEKCQMYAVLKDYKDANNPGTRVDLILPAKNFLSTSRLWITEIHLAFGLTVNYWVYPAKL